MKKLSIIALTIILALSLFAGCGGASGSGKVTVRFATWDSAEDLDEQQALADKFNASQDKITVTIEAYGDDFDTKIAASMGSNDAPDVMYMWNYPAYSGGLEPLNSYIDKEGAGFKDNYYAAMWPYNSIGDNIYGMPVGYTTHVLFFNKDMFDKAGISYPTADWTWQDVYDASKAITEAYDDGNTKGFVFPIEYDPYDFEMYLWSNGTAFCDASGNIDGYANSAAAVEVYSMFQKLAQDGYAIPAENYGTSIMTSQNAAMYINGAWPISRFNEAEINFGVVELPQFKAGQNSASILSSSGLAMSKDSKQKDAAWEFIKFWTGEEANIARIDYELPVLKSVVASKGVDSDPVKKVFYDMLAQSEGHTPASFIVSDWSSVNDKLLLAFEHMFNPTSYADPQASVDSAVK